MNIHRRSNDTNEQVEAIKREMFACSFANDSNDDMTIDVKGYLHNNRGFILTVQNMEKITDSILQSWRYLVEKKGFRCDMTYDFNDGWVDVKCQKHVSKSCLKARQLSIIGYLSVLFFCIYLIWSRQSKMLQR